MAKLNRVQQHELAGSFSVAPLFGGFFNSVGGFFNAPDGEQINNKHLQAIVNLLDSIARYTDHLPRIQIFMDDGDGEDEFSADAFEIEFAGHLCSYAGATGQGPLTRGVTNLIWFDLTAAPTVTLGFGEDLPEEGHILPVAAIAMPAAGPWVPTQITRTLGRRNAPVSTRPVLLADKAINFASGATTALVTIAAGQVVRRVVVNVLTAFDGTTPKLSVGDSGDVERLMAEAAVDLTTPGVYLVDCYHRYAAQTAVVATLTLSAATQGAAEIFVE